MLSKKRVAAIQMSSVASVQDNLHTAERLIRKCADNDVALIVLPENVAFIGKDETDKLLIAENPGHGTIQNFFSLLANELDLWIVAGTIPLKVASADENRVHAASLVWDNKGQMVARYDKIHLFDVVIRPLALDVDHAYPDNKTLEYLESKTICSGQDIVSLYSPIGKLGLSVCYDLRFPELYRKLLSEGAEVLLVPSAFTAVTGEAHWESLLRARAIENFSYVIAPNQFGLHANGRASFGHSMIVDPWGKIVAMQAEGEGVIYAEIDLEYLYDIRSRFPVQQHRRIF